jgi:hypothetical protein
MAAAGVPVPAVPWHHGKLENDYRCEARGLLKRLYDEGTVSLRVSPASSKVTENGRHDR